MKSFVTLIIYTKRRGVIFVQQKIKMSLLIVLLVSYGALASFSIGFKIVIGGSVLPTLALKYEHESGHGLELTAGVLVGGADKFLVRGEVGYSYKYKNIFVGVGRGITRYGAKKLPVFDDHMKMGYVHLINKNTSIDAGATLSLGTVGQGLAFWGGLNKYY